MLIPHPSSLSSAFAPPFPSIYQFCSTLVILCLLKSLSLSLSSSLCKTVNRDQAMANTMLMLALCILPALVSSARPAPNPLILTGRIYCDTCRAGFETSATTYITGAKVRVECRNRDSQELLFSTEGTTDSTGTYTILVNEDHKDQLCDAILVSSPQSDCKRADPGRDRARVILTRYNGMASDNRFANNMGFMKDQPMTGCETLLQQYLEVDD